MSNEPFPPQPGPGPGPQAPPPGSGGDRFFDSIRRSGLARSEDRWVGGVAAGVAERLGWDPLLVRGLLFLSFFLTGVGLVVYAVGWALLPERRDGRIHLQQALRGDFDVALLGAVATLLVGFAWGDGVGSWWNGGWHWIISLFWIAVWVTLGWLLFRFLRNRRVERQAYQAPRGPDGRPYPPQTGGGAGPYAPSAPYPTQGGPAAFAAPPTPGAGPAPAQPDPAQPFAPGADAREQAAWARAEASRARAEARAQAADARIQAAQHRNQWSAEQAAARAQASQQRAQARLAERAARPITKGPGAGTVGVVIGLLLIAGALMLAQNRWGLALPRPFDGGYELVLAWLGVSLVVIGAGIVVSGIRGRSSGWLGFLAIVGLVVALPWGVMTGDGGFPYARLANSSEWSINTQHGTDISEGTFVARSLAEAERGYRVQFGDPTIDLSQLDLSGVTAGSPAEVPISLAAGDLTVVVPPDTAVEADVRLLAGQVVWRVDGQERTVNRVGSATVHLSSDEASATGATLRLVIAAGAGNITVEENR